MNTLSSDNKTEREVERKRAGLSFLIDNLGVPWALRTNSQVLLRSCPKCVVVFFRRGLQHWAVLTWQRNNETVVIIGYETIALLILFDEMLGKVRHVTPDV